MTVKPGFRRGKGCLLALVIGASAGGCDGPHRVPVPPPLEEEAFDMEPAATPKVVPEVASSEPTAADDAPAAKLHPFTEAPHSDRRTLAHVLEPKARIGVYLGLPDGWRNDDPSYLLFFPSGKAPRPPARAVAMTLMETGLAEVNKERLLRRGSKPTGLRDAKWSAWQPELVGRRRFSGVIARGTGMSIRGAEGARSAIAVVVDIPGAPAVGFVGSWANAEPQHEAVIVDMLRALDRCQIEVGRGCVTAEERKHASR